MKLPTDFNLPGKTVVVTGGGGVLCGMFARALGSLGASVAVLDLREDAAKLVADDIVRSG